MISKREIKSLLCIGRSFDNAADLPSLLSAIIISLMETIRSASKNICSVRHKPMPSAPNSRATLESSIVSAFVRTTILRSASAHSIKVAKAFDNCGFIVATCPLNTCPVIPSIVIISPFLNSISPMNTRPVPVSILSSPAPETHGLPIPLATTAA